MRRHASLDELADLEAGNLRARKAVRIERHLAVCAQCTETNSQLAAVPSVLSSARYPAMPANLSVRIDAALASEVNLRQASAPATEAARGELPARGSNGNGSRGRGGWRLPGLTGPAAKVVTAAAALVIIGGGGYLAATNLGSSGPGSASSSSSATRAPQAGAAGGGAGEVVGPRITYGPTDSARTIQTVTTDTNFVPAKLDAQATAAVRTARQNGVHSGPAHHVSALPDVHSGASGSPVSRAGFSSTQLEGCVSALAPGRTVLLVEVAKFEGKPATIIVAAAAEHYQAEVWVVGTACSTARHDVLDHQKLAHI